MEMSAYDIMIMDEAMNNLGDAFDYVLYEQLNKDIIKANVTSVVRLARTLGCIVEYLIEYWLYCSKKIKYNDNIQIKVTFILYEKSI